MSRCAPPRGRAQRNIPLWRSGSARSAETREVLVQLQRVGRMQAVQGDGLVCHAGLGGFDSHRLLEAWRMLLSPLAGGRVVVDTLVFQTRPPGSIPTARSIENICCAPSIVSAARPRRGRHVLCRSRPRNRVGHVHPPQDVRSCRGAREISAKLVVAGMTSNGGPHRGPGRRRSARWVDLDPAMPPVMADFARAWSSRSAPLQRRRGALRPLPVWRHTGIWDRSSAGRAAVC